MKKFITTFCLSLAILCIGVFGLVGCDSDEFANADEITSEDFGTYVQAETTSNEITSYTFKFDAVYAIAEGQFTVTTTGEGENAVTTYEAYMKITEPAIYMGDTMISQEYSETYYFKNNTLYINDGESKTRTSYEFFDTICGYYYESFDAETFLEELCSETSSSIEMTYQKVEKDSTTKFLVTQYEVQDDESKKEIGTAKLTYNDGALTEYSTVQIVDFSDIFGMGEGVDVKVTAKITATTSSISFPSFDDYVAA